MLERKIYVNNDTKIIQQVYDDNTFTWIVKKTDLCDVQYACVDNVSLAEVMEHAKKGEVQCSTCGKWLPVSKAHHHVPAGCSCDKCEYEASKAEREFLSMLD